MASINGILSLVRDVSWLKTIYFNLHYFSVKQAVKLPVFIFRNTKLSDMKGQVLLNGAIRTGGVSIGKYGVGTLDIRYDRTIWSNCGTVVFNGDANIGSGSRLSVNREGTLTFGNKFCITGNSSVICSNDIKFGDNVLLSWDILVMDTDFHKLLNEKDEHINPSKPILLGDRVWVGCRATILKGVTICNDVVVAAGSVVTRSVSAENTVIGGANGQKVIREGIRWQM